MKPVASSLPPPNPSQILLLRIKDAEKTEGKRKEVENQSGVVQVCVFYPVVPSPNVEGETLSLPYLPRTAVGDRELAQAVVVDAGVREGTFLQRVGPQQGFQAAAVLRDQPFLLQGLVGVCRSRWGKKGRGKSARERRHVLRSHLTQPRSQASLLQRGQKKGFTNPHQHLLSSGAIWARYCQKIQPLLRAESGSGKDLPGLIEGKESLGSSGG